MLDRFARDWLVRRLRRSFYGWDAERLRRHQDARLHAMTRAITRLSPYYRRLRLAGWDGLFEHLPRISKTELIAHYDEINTAGLRKDDLFAFAVAQERGDQSRLYHGRYSVGLSSGTSGTRLPAVLSARERWEYGSLLVARSGIPSSVRRPRVLFLLRVNNPAFTEVRFLGIDMVHSDYTRSPEELVDLINSRRLNVLAGPPSMLRLLSELRDRIRVPVEALISYAEVLDDGTRQRLQASFGVPVAEIYQGTEGFIASTCTNGRLHLNEDVVFVEAVDAGDESGRARRVVVTDLYRTTLPIVRYELNDIIELGEQACSCGSCFRVVERVHGRADDVFYLRASDGGIRYLFPDYVTRSINQASEDVLEFQALQHAPDRIEVRLEMRPRADGGLIQRRILSNLEYWTGRIGGDLGQVEFSQSPPERNRTSGKLIRVSRRFEWK